MGAYKQGKHHYAEKEIHKLMELLKRVLIHLEGFVRKGWQVKSIVNILEKMLGVENIQSIRMAAFSAFLLFLEVMERPDRHKLDLYASIIDYTPFTPDYTYKINFARKVFSGTEAKRFIVIQASESPTREDSARLFEAIFVHVSSRLNASFPFWFDLIKCNYLTVLYPSISKKIGLLPPTDNTGFGSHCPHELQVIVINYLAAWVASSQSVRTFLLDNADAALTTSPTPITGLTTSTPGTGKMAILLEIFKQSCRLPLRHADVIKKSIQTFQALILTNTDLVHVFGDEYYTYQTFVLSEMMTVFETEASTHEREREAIGMYVIGVFRSLVDSYSNLLPRTREILLHSMLQATTTLLRRANPNKSVSLTLEQSLVSTTLHAWIKSRETSPTMWEQLHTHFEDLFFRVEVLKQIKSKCIQVTLLLRDLVYPVSEKRAIKRAKDVKSAEKGGEPKSPDSIESPPDLQVETTIASVSWDIESCLSVWHFLLDILRNVHRIKDPLIHELGTGILVDIVDVLVKAEQEAEFSTIDRMFFSKLPV
eukprot:gene16307-19395_t